MNEATIVCQDVSKVFVTKAETLAVLKEINLEVNPGSKIGIFGSSGCGKSTLLSLLGGLDKPTSGSLCVGGQRLDLIDNAMLSAFRATKVGFVFQFHFLLKDFTAIENVALPAIMVGVPKKDAFDRASSLLESIDLGSRMHHLPSQLSGGEKQRISVARALVNHPAIVLADEPTGNLDPSHALGVRDLLVALSEKENVTLVIASHDAHLAEAMDCIYEIIDGRLELR